MVTNGAINCSMGISMVMGILSMKISMGNLSWKINGNNPYKALNWDINGKNMGKIGVSWGY
jgi:hypothetical protein